MGYSFYGGKQGRTYNLVAHYDSIYQMVLNFQEGGSYTDANYNEYVIIDTFINRNEKSNRENGIIYRRGLNYSEPFNPQGIESVDTNTHTIDENATHTMTLIGEIGTIYQDSDIPTMGPESLSGQFEVPRYRHFEYILTEDNEGNAQAEIHPKDFIREGDRGETPVTLFGEPGVRYEDGYVGGGSLSVTLHVPQYNHYSYVLHNENGITYASITPGKEKTGIVIPDTIFNIDWSKFVLNPGGGAVYVGQITGPQGESPELTMTDWEIFERDYLKNPQVVGNKGGGRLFRRPGFEDGLIYNDEIQYGWATVKDAQGNVDYAVISLDIPYTVFKYDVHSVSPYGPSIIEVGSLPEYPEAVNTYYHLEEDDSYYIWDETNTVDTIQIQIESLSDLPKGRDVNIQNYYFLRPSMPTTIHYHYEPDLPVSFVIELPIEEDLIDPNRYYYLELDDGTHNIGYYQYDEELQDWNKIATESLYVTVNDVPTTIYYPKFVKTEIWAVSRYGDSGEYLYTNMLREKAESDGHPYYKYYELFVPKGIHGDKVDNFVVTDEFELRYDRTTYDDLESGYAGVTEPDIYAGTLRVIQNTEMLETDDNNNPISFLQFTYWTIDQETQDYEKQRVPITRVQRVEMGRTGELKIYFRKGTLETSYVLGQLSWITNAVIDETKHLTITYNNNADSHGGQVVSLIQLRTVDQIGLENDKTLDKDKRFFYHYDVKADDEETNENHYFDEDITVDTIVKIQLYGDNIVVLYSDPTHRRTVRDTKPYYLLPYRDTEWSFETADVSDATGDYFYWENLGPALIGQHVFGHFPDYDTLIRLYPYGFENDTEGHPIPEQEKYAGWVASVVTYDATEQITFSAIYGYDYIGTKGWYEISQLDVAGFNPEKTMIISVPDPLNARNPLYKGEILEKKGYWLVSADIPIASDDE